MNRLIRFFVITFLFLVTACGGGGTGGGSTSTTPKVGGKGISGSGAPVAKISVGSIDGFGSVTLNGVFLNNVRYDIESASLSVDGQPAQQSDLALGQVIKINGTIDEDNQAVGTADELVYLSNVIGPVGAIDSSTPGVKVLGQSITVDNSTVFGGINNFDDITRSQIVRVSGFADSNGDLLASRIDLATAGASYQVVGNIETLNMTNMQLTINELTVDYSNTVVNGSLSEGSQILVKGSTLNADGHLIAETIEVLDGSLGDSDQAVDLEGLMTRFISATDFDVSGYAVTTNSNTLVENGSLDDLGLDARVEVEGELIGNTVLATKITIIHTGPQSFVGSLAADESISYKIQSTDEDTGLWVTMTDIEGYTGLSVRDEQGTPVCQQLEANQFAPGLCYVENTGAAEWTIVVESYNESSYKLDAYLRRAPLTLAKPIAASTPITADLYAGDRSQYSLSTDNAPSEYWLGVIVDNLSDDGQLFVKANGQANAGSYDCNLIFGNRQNTCWLNSQDANDWSIALASSVDKEYSLRADFIVPTPLDSNQRTNDTITVEQGHLYTFESTADTQSIAVLVKNNSGNIRLQIGADQPPQRDAAACEANSDIAINITQCIAESNGSGLWYVLVTGEVGTTYDISSINQTLKPATQAMAIGDRLRVQQAAGTVATYTVPKGSIGSIFSAGIVDEGSAKFIVSVDDVERINGYPICITTFINNTERQCRAVNDASEGNWIIKVKSAEDGEYTLWLEDQTILPLTAGSDISASLPDNGDAGIIYRVDTPEGATAIDISLTNKSGEVGLLAKDDVPPSTGESLCKTTPDANNTICSTGSHGEPYWYINVYGDAGATFDINVVFSQ